MNPPEFKINAKNSAKNFVLPTLLVVTMAWSLAGSLPGSRASQNSSYDDWQTQQTKYDLLDREKILLKKDDDLGRHIYDIKQNIKALMDALTASQSEQDRVRHELIIVRVKLLH